MTHVLTAPRRSATHAVVAAIAVCLLGLADACLTLVAIARGGFEANPIMRAFLEIGAAEFVVAKMAMTVIGAILICAYLHERMGRRALTTVLATYGVLIGWHAYIQAIV